MTMCHLLYPDPGHQHLYPSLTIIRASWVSMFLYLTLHHLFSHVKLLEHVILPLNPIKMCLYLTWSKIKNYYTGVSVTYCCVTSHPPNLVAKSIVYIHDSLICIVFSWEVLLLVLSGVTHLAVFWGLLLAGIAG